MANQSQAVKPEAAKYGAATMAGLEGQLPISFPRVMGPRAME